MGGCPWGGDLPARLPGGTLAVVGARALSINPMGATMNVLTSTWYFRVGVIAALTWAAHKYLPLGPVGKTISLAIGGISAAGIVAQNVPLVASALNGQLPATATTTA